MSVSHHLLTPRAYPRLLSIVMPVYNEQDVVAELRRRVTDFLATLPGEAEVVLVNDGSADQTLEMLLLWAREDRRIKVVGLARNFGHQLAITAGMDMASGDAIVVMDSDLQDPPEVIPDMIREYCKGYDVVYGKRTSRSGDSPFKKMSCWVFYRMMTTLIHKDLPTDVGDFRLISRTVLDALKSMRETHRFLRGMVTWVGFPQTAVYYDRHARHAGDSKYPFRKLLKLAWTGAISFSALPLRISLGLGLFSAGLGLIVGVYAVTSKIVAWAHGQNVTQGWTSLTCLICLLCGAVLVSNGILGEYIGRIFEEIKGRPLYLVSLTANLPKSMAAPERTIVAPVAAELQPAAPNGSHAVGAIGGAAVAADDHTPAAEPLAAAAGTSETRL